MRLARNLVSFCIFGALTTITACGDDGAGGEDNEVITTVTLELVPMGGGDTVTASFNDADGDGGGAPIIDPLNLVTAKTYAVTVRFLNALETPPEDITVEVRDESDEHFVFFTGTAVNGPATNQPAAPVTHTYADMDANGIPIGLSNTFVTRPGTGQLTVTLRHLPPVNDTAVKTADLPMQIKNSGFAALPGSSDVSVTFMTTVQ